MPRFTVIAVERFTVRTTYHNVMADSKAKALAMCKNGDVPYTHHEILEGGELWLETESVVQED